MIDVPNMQMKKRLSRDVVIVLLIVVVYICWSIFNISINESGKWKKNAENQQMKDTVLHASRGNIYDVNGQILAQSSTVYTIYCDPVMLKAKLKEKDANIENLKELIKKEKDENDKVVLQAKLDKAESSENLYGDLVEFLSKKLDVDIEKVKKCCSNEDSMYEIIKKQVDKAVLDEITDYLNDKGIDGVRGEPSTKRFYPQGTLAANILGHLDYEGNGEYGIEAKYDNFLRGIDGRTSFLGAADETQIPYKNKLSYKPQDGDSVVLNIDIDIQYRLEKALESACERHKPKERACGIIMNPKTGAVYAMATNYSYDPNDPTKITDKNIAEELKNMDQDSKEYDDKRTKALSTQWKNKAISELYNPGSVFKVITGASALDCSAITLDDTFSCNTAIYVADQKIHCWSDLDHGMQNLQVAMTHSCNPAFVQIGQRMGVDNFCKYFRSFGFYDKTGIDLPAEADSYCNDESMSIVDLSVSSFGQSNKITPIQMITAYCASINGGYLVTPQIVNRIVDSKGSVVKKNETEIKRQVISEETSAQIREILENVVNDEKDSNAYIKGYRIGGKSGTSQKMDVDVTGNTYVASYCAFAPADDPEVVMFVMVDDPKGGEYYGSQVAAPICTEVFEQILPRMQIFPDYTEEELANLQVNTSDFESQPVDKAKETLQQLDLDVKVYGNGSKVVKQIPLTTEVQRGSTVILYTEEDYEEQEVYVPNLKGLTKSKAKEMLEYSGLNLSVTDESDDQNDALASNDQSYPAMKLVPEGTAVSVTFKSNKIGSQ